MGPIRFHMDNTTTSASTVTREMHTPFEYRPVGQSMNSLYDNQTSLQRSDWGNRGAQRGNFSQIGSGEEKSLKPGTMMAVVIGLITSFFSTCLLTI